MLNLSQRDSYLKLFNQQGLHTMAVDIVKELNKAGVVPSELLTDRMIDLGKLFYVLDIELDLSDGQAVNFLLRTGACPAHFNATVVNASGGPIFANIYEDAVIGSPIGSPITPLNANRVSTNVPLTQIFGDPSVIDKGTPIDTQRIPPQIAGEAGGVFAAGLPKAPSKIIMKENSDYLIELLNDPTGAGTGDADVYTTISFYELQ